MSQAPDLSQLRPKLDALGLGEVAMQQVGTGNALSIRLAPQDGGEAAQTAAVAKVRDTLASVDDGARIDRTEVVGPKISGELAQSGLIAVVLAGLGMLGYIWCGSSGTSRSGPSPRWCWTRPRRSVSSPCSAWTST